MLGLRRGEEDGEEAPSSAAGRRRLPRRRGPMARTTSHLYDAVPIQSSVVLCSCPSPSMVRTQTESSTAPGIPSGGSRQSPTMEGTTAEARPGANSLQHAAQPPPQPRKKRPEDFKFGKILGEGSFSTVSICSAIEPAAVLEQKTQAQAVFVLQVVPGRLDALL